MAVVVAVVAVVVGVGVAVVVAVGVTTARRTHERDLVGKYSHWCPEWDFMPIDETCKEFEFCSCYPTKKKVMQNDDT